MFLTLPIVPLAQTVCNVASQIWHRQRFFHWTYFNIMMMVRRLAIMGVTWFLTLLNNLANKDLLWRDSALPVKPCVELRGLLDDFWYWHCPNCFDSSRDVFVCQILLNLLGVQLCILDLRLLGRGMQVHWLMEGRKMRNPRYSNYMIKCPCAEKNTWWFQGLYVEVCFAPSCLNSGPFCPKACT